MEKKSIKQRLKDIINIILSKQKIIEPVKKKQVPFRDNFETREEKLEKFYQQHIQRTASEDIVTKPIGTMDSSQNITSGYLNPGFNSGFNSGIPNSLLSWYGTQSFIGYQTCALLAQQWLILKCCNVPAEDAIREGYEITSCDGENLNPDIYDEMVKADVRYNINAVMKEFICMGKIFGFRIAIFKIESDDPDFYLNPFNLDGITPGSYKGIVQVDPYWITPELDFESGADPASLHFYEPTWWRVGGQRYHRTHLIIFRNAEVADILKPTYLYGGIPLPQLIYERVYCAERTANEAPQLAVAKRRTFVKTDTAEFLANEQVATENMQKAIAFQDNFNMQVIDRLDDVVQFDISLSDFELVTTMQYELVASAANVPFTKLLGKTPKGMNSTGEYDEANYHEELKGIQKNHLTRLLERHHEILIRSEILPMNLGLGLIKTGIKWNALDARTEEEQALINRTKVETDEKAIYAGMISPEEARERLIKDPLSGYNGLSEIMETSEFGDNEQGPGTYSPFEKNIESDPEEEEKKEL